MPNLIPNRKSALSEAPAPVTEEERIVAREHLRLLALGYYIKGAITILLVSFLLIHFSLFLGVSFVPESAWNSASHSPAALNNAFALPSPAPHGNNAPPVILFRILAGVIGVVILLGWTFGLITMFAGRCVHQRQHKIFVYVIAGVNCIFIPYGTLLGVATFLVLSSAAANIEFPRSGGVAPLS
jgi:hypothetical protein